MPIPGNRLIQLLSGVTIRTQLLGVALVCLLPMAALALYQVHDEVAEARRNVERLATTIAKVNAAEISRILSVTEKVLARLADNPDIRSLDHGRCGHLFDHFPEVYPHHSNLLTKDINGFPVCSALPVPTAARVNLNSYMDEVRRANGFAVGKPNLGPLSRRWVVPLEYPLRDQAGEIIGTVSAPLDLLNFNPFVGAGAFDGLPEGTTATLFAPDMTLLARSLDSEKWVGSRGVVAPEMVELVAQRTGTARFVSRLDGIERIHAAASVPGTEWTTIASIPTGPMDIRLSDLARKWLVIVGATALLSAALAFVLARRMAKPLLAVAATAERVGRGDTAARALPAGSSEVIAFATAFNDMLDGLQRQQEALAASEGRFRSLVEGTTDWVWETDANHRFSWVSPTYEQIVGASSSPVVGRYRWDLASKEREIDAGLWQAHMEDMAAHRAFRDFRYWMDVGEGRCRWISVSGAPRFDAAGAFLGYRGSGADITGLAAQSMRLRMLSTVVEQSPVSVVITDPEGKIEYVNAHFTTVSGYSSEEAIGANARLLASGETPTAVYGEMWATISAGQRWVGELRNRRKDGSLHWEMVAIAPVLDEVGQIAHYVAIKEDVTERRALQDKLRQSNAELEQFAYVASHDLRQPLRMVTSYLGLIERRLRPVMTDEIKGFLDYAVDGAKRMDHLILDLLEYSRTGRTSCAGAVALGQVVADALLNLTVAVREADAEVEVTDDLPTIGGDPGELTRLFQNLIGNAIKYRAPDRRPRIEISCRRFGREWRIMVKDNGTGIAPEDFERVFAIFQRLVPQGECEGTGIGLAICRKIAEHHGGRIWVESVVGEGSVFVVALPAAEPAKGGQGDGQSKAV